MNLIYFGRTYNQLTTPCGHEPIFQKQSPVGLQVYSQVKSPTSALRPTEKVILVAPET